MSDSIISSLPPPPAPFVDATGIHAPVFHDYLTYLILAYQAIYGADSYLASDSKDGQLLSIFALALGDNAAATIGAYNSFSPSSAQGVGLSTNVKINGMIRKAPTFSTVDVRCVGVAGTPIGGGTVSDSTNRFTIPDGVVIPDAGEITITATAQTIGDIRAGENTVNKIETPTAGWQSVNNPTAAFVGQPVEQDAFLRRRQQASTALPSVLVLDGIIGALAALPGVIRIKAYENDSALTDANGIPSHSLSMVIEGGDLLAIAATIALKKSPGAGTYGTTSVDTVDNYGVPHTIKFYRPSYVTITVVVTVHNLTGYTTIIGNEIVASVVAAINGVSIGDDVLYTRLFVPAQLLGQYSQATNIRDASTFELISVMIARDGNTVAAADVDIVFNEAALSDTAHVTLTVV